MVAENSPEFQSTGTQNSISNTENTPHSQIEQLNIENAPNSKIEQSPKSSDINPAPVDKKMDNAERDESMLEEAAGAVVSSKSLFLGILVFMSALFGMGILDNSSCGGSLSFKLFPPELELNRSSCINTERLPQSK